MYRIEIQYNRHIFIYKLQMPNKFKDRLLHCIIISEHRTWYNMETLPLRVCISIYTGNHKLNEQNVVSILHIFDVVCASAQNSFIETKQKERIGTVNIVLRFTWCIIGACISATNRVTAQRSIHKTDFHSECVNNGKWQMDSFSNETLDNLNIRTSITNAHFLCFAESLA